MVFFCTRDADYKEMMEMSFVSDVYTERLEALVIDEAHCVKNGKSHVMLPGTQLMALTATATKMVQTYMYHLHHWSSIFSFGGLDRDCPDISTRALMDSYDSRQRPFGGCCRFLP